MKNNLFVTVFILISLMSCESNEGPEVNPSKANISVESVLRQLAPQSEMFTVLANQGGNILASQGTEIFIPPNAFIDASGQLVNGNVEIEVKEVFSKRDIVLVNIPTITENGLLVSGGELYIQASQNMNNLTLAENVSLGLRSPAINEVGSYLNDMALYTASSSFSTTGDTTFVWANPDSITVVEDSTGGASVYSYLAEIWEMGWKNIDAPYISTASNTTVSCNLLDNPHNLVIDGTAVFFVPKEIYSAMRFWYNTNNETYQSRTDFIPIGMEATVFAISTNIDGEELHLGFQEITVTENMEVELTFQPTTEANLVGFLDNL